MITNLALVAYVGVQDLWVASIAPAMAVVSYAITLVLIVRRAPGIGCVADLPLIGYRVVTVIGAALILARCWAIRPRVRFVQPLVEV